MNEKVKEVLESFLDKLNVPVDSIEVVEHKLHPIFSIKTPDSALLIGSRGETLQALNYVVKKIFSEKGDEQVKFIIDVNDYHARKLKEIEQRAEASADRVRLFKRDVEMDPMNAYERMVVHSLFADDPHIKTHSEGDGTFRRVILRYGEEV